MQGTSRGGADIKEIVKRIDMWAIDMVFVVGGNGGNAGAQVRPESSQLMSETVDRVRVGPRWLCGARLCRAAPESGAAPATPRPALAARARARPAA